MRFNLLIALSLSIFASSQAVWAADDDDDYYEQKRHRGVQSVEAYEMGEPTTVSLTLQAQHCLKNGYVDKAIKYCQRSINKNYDDAEAHLIYAQALQKKLEQQPIDERDDSVFEKCVKEWLIVLRNEAGMESGSSFRGWQIPGLAKEYEDEEHGGQARQALKHLVGTLPKVWETDAKYMRRVCKPGAAALAGRLVDDGKKSGAGKATANKTTASKSTTAE